MIKLFRRNKLKVPKLPELSEIDFRGMRNKMGLTIREVAGITGISATHISRLEAYKASNPSYESIKKLLSFYELSPNVK